MPIISSNVRMDFKSCIHCFKPSKIMRLLCKKWPKIVEKLGIPGVA